MSIQIPTFSPNFDNTYCVYPQNKNFNLAEQSVNSQWGQQQQNLSGDDSRIAIGYSVIYYLYFITINLLHLAITIAGILVSADIFDENTDKWIVIGISIVAPVSLCLTDLMNGFQIQSKKDAFAGTIYTKPKWTKLLA